MVDRHDIIFLAKPHEERVRKKEQEGYPKTGRPISRGRPGSVWASFKLVAYARRVSADIQYTWHSCRMRGNSSNHTRPAVVELSPPVDVARILQPLILLRHCIQPSPP